MSTQQKEKKQLEESLAEIKEQEEEVSRANRALTLRLEDVQVRSTTLHVGKRDVEVHPKHGFNIFNIMPFSSGTWQNWTLNTRIWRRGYKRRRLRRSSSRAWRTTSRMRGGSWTTQWRNSRGRWVHSAVHRNNNPSKWLSDFFFFCCKKLSCQLFNS